MVSRSKSKTRKQNNRKSKKTKNKINYELHYFRMDGCKWCEDFQNTLLPKLLKKKNLTIKIFNKSENPELVEKYNIQTYPALVRVRGKRHKLFKVKRNMKNILNFLR
jgi:hypothetical protein